MFVATSHRLFWWPVTVRVPDGEQAGKFVAHSFEAQFRAMPLSRGREIDELLAALPPDERDAKQHDYLHEMVTGWREVVDADSVAVPFSREAFAAQLEFAWFRAGILTAYQQAVTGETPPALGN